MTGLDIILTNHHWFWEVKWHESTEINMIKNSSFLLLKSSQSFASCNTVQVLTFEKRQIQKGIGSSIYRTIPFSLAQKHNSLVQMEMKHNTMFSHAQNTQRNNRQMQYFFHTVSVLHTQLRKALLPITQHSAFFFSFLSLKILSIKRYSKLFQQGWQPRTRIQLSSCSLAIVKSHP